MGRDVGVAGHGIIDKGQHVLAAVRHLDVPGLVIDAGTDVIDLLRREPQCLGDEQVAALNAMA